PPYVLEDDAIFNFVKAELEKSHRFSESNTPDRESDPLAYNVYLVAQGFRAEQLTVNQRIDFSIKANVERLKATSARLLLQAPQEAYDLAVEKISPDAKRFWEIVGEAQKIVDEHILLISKPSQEWHQALIRRYNEIRDSNPIENAPQLNALDRMTPRGALSRRQNQDRRALSQAIHDRGKSISQLTSLVKDFSKRGVESQYFYTEVHSLILNNPNWVSSQDDIDNLLDNKEFWRGLNLGDSQLDIKMFSTSPLEKALAEMYKELNLKREVVYHPKDCLEMHELIVSRLKALKIYPTSPEEKFNLWIKMTKYAPSYISDSLFKGLIVEDGNTTFSSKFRETIMSKAEQLLGEARILDPALSAIMAWEVIEKDATTKQIQSLPYGADRKKLVSKQLGRLQGMTPFRGPYFSELLEKFSVLIMSSYEEAQYLQEAKIEGTRGESKEGLATQLFDSIRHFVNGLSKKQQWEFFKFMRYEADEFKPLDNQLPNFEAVTFRAMFSNLPHEAKVFFFDTLLSSKPGLLGHRSGNVNTSSGWFKTIFDHLLQETDRKTKVQVLQVIRSLLKALEQKEMGPVGSFIVANILVNSPGQTLSAGQILAQTLAYVGALGIKIGQVILAAQLLPPEEAKHLAHL
ncbi:MAG: hypothetical protein KDD22_05300, partial [Bdellovibrionales bacterium]|nr:hypothetical protein [Bdellovibrionales bacterium]